MYCFWLHNWLKKTSSFTKSDQEIVEMDCLKLRCVMFCHVEMFLYAFPDVGDDDLLGLLGHFMPAPPCLQ